MQSHFDEVVDFVNTTFQGKNIKHFERVVYWFEQFVGRPLTEAEKIVAYSHDIERGFRGSDKPLAERYTDPEFLRYHQEKGAEIMAEFLTAKGLNPSYIELIKHLISKHEQGGDEMQDKLMDADSTSFFETNAEYFATEKVKAEGYDKVREKFDWMFTRIKSEQARTIAKPLYDKWVDAIAIYK